VLAFVAACSNASGSSSGPNLDTSTWPGECSKPLPTTKVSLPKDDSLHSDDVEWWYWTGHLKAADGRWFGFEEVFFRAARQGVRGVMVHSALTDVKGQKFLHRSNLSLSDVPQTPNGFDYASYAQTAVGGDGHDTLHGEGQGYSFDLTLDATKRPTLQHDLGYTDYSFGGYTYYYSRERMAVSGTVVLGDETVAVTGTGWFDHQYGDIGTAVNKGWDWFAIQLDDNREIMLFVVKDGATPVVVGASMTDANCVTTALEPKDFDVVPQGTWKSPHTDCTYPQGWKVRVKDMNFDVASVVADQEVYKSTPIYWEGAATVTGSATGRAYVELSGYCEVSTTPVP
jgi:predicted secreted hydrolase